MCPVSLGVLNFVRIGGYTRVRWQQGRVRVDEPISGKHSPRGGAPAVVPMGIDGERLMIDHVCLVRNFARAPAHLLSCTLHILEKRKRTVGTWEVESLVKGVELSRCGKGSMVMYR